MKHLCLIWTVFVLLLMPNISLAQCTLACNDQVNVSIPATGFGVVLPDMILDGNNSTCPGPKIVEVYAPTGANLGDTVTCSLVGNLLMVAVIDINSGNSCWGSIHVEDKLPPVITCQNLTVPCTADLTPAGLGFPTVTDNCDSNPALTYAQVAVPQPCGNPNVSVITRTWYSVDDNGNAAVPCVQTITVDRPTLSDVVFPPNLDNNQAPALNCGNTNTSPSNTGYPTIDGNPVIALCKINVEYLDQTLNQCGGAFTILRKWKIIDCCTNQIVNHTQTIVVQDVTPPSIVCTDTIIVGANGPGCAGTFFLPPVQASDNCSNPLTFKTILPNQVISGNGGMVFALPLGQYNLTYEVQDACFNTATCNVVLIVKDNVAPVAICDETTVVSLNANGLATVAATVFDDGSYDACCAVTFEVKRMEQPDSLFGPTVQFNCSDVGDTVRVVLKVKDCHGNTNTCMVLVFVQDKIPPSITCPAPVTLPCDTPQPLPLLLTGQPQVSENCTIDTLFFTDNENLNMCNSGTVTRTFTVIDIAGFQATCSQTITLIDTTASQFFFPADTMVDCSVPLDQISGGQVLALADCELFGLNISDEVFPVPCGQKIFRTYTFKDWCSGQDTSYTQLIEVLDVNPPVWDVPLGSFDRLFLCEGDFVKPAPPTATDYCTPATVELVKDTIIHGTCPNRFTRILTYSATDTCGNVSVPFVAVLEVRDTVPPTANPLPGIGPLACYGNRPSPNPLVVTGETDNCINPVTVAFVSDSGDPGCSGTAVRTYRVTDVCGNQALITQNILINDNQPPTASPLPALGPFACVGEIPAPNVANVLGETDNCGGPVTVQFEADSGNPGCNGTVTRTYRLIDQCGNFTLINQSIFIHDTVPPLLSWSDTVMATIPGLGCETFVNVNASALDNCPGRSFVISNSFNSGGGNASGIYPAGETLVTFVVEDECGNVDSVHTVVIVEDQVSPSIKCMPIELSLDAAGMAVVPFDSLIKAGYLIADDLCTDVTVTFTPDTLDCSFIVTDPTVVDYVMVVEDAFGNLDSCTGDIILYDPFNVCLTSPPLVAGMIFNENFQAMPSVEVQMQDGGNMSFAYTSADGIFQFSDVPPGSSCLLKPVKNDGLLNGVTTFDIVLLTRHILGTHLLDSPYKIIAADVNNSGAVTTFDAVHMRMAILQISNEFPNNNSWRFIRSGYEFPNPANPFAETFPENAWLPNISHDLTGQSFVAVKIGDLNGSATVNFTGEPEERGGGAEFVLSTDSRFLKKGETAVLPVLAETTAGLAALQLTLQFDPRLVLIKKLNAGTLAGFDEKNYAQPENGYLTLSWDAPAGQLLEANTTLFFIEIQALTNISLEEALIINSTLTPAIAYENGGNPLNIGWRIHEASQVSVDAARLFLLAQNRPNPFGQETRIEFELKERMQVRLEVFDLAGRKWQVLDGIFDAGRHEASVNGSELGQPGIYFYQIITPYGTERRKMIRS
jgi:hypothetical protein